MPKNSVSTKTAGDGFCAAPHFLPTLEALAALQLKNSFHPLPHKK
jgi:hypothetical protein